MTPEPVAEYLRQRFADWVDKRTEKGVATYGHPLSTFNGRDARQDAFDELLDFCQYQQEYIMELEADILRLRERTHQIAEAADAKWRMEARAVARWKDDVRFVTREIGLREESPGDGVVGHSWACRAIAAQYKQQRDEAEAAVRTLAEAIRSYQQGCPDNHHGKACGGDWPCDHVEGPMRQALALPTVDRILVEGFDAARRLP